MAIFATPYEKPVATGAPYTQVWMGGNGGWDWEVVNAAGTQIARGREMVQWRAQAEADKAFHAAVAITGA